MIKRSISYKEKYILIRLYKSLVRPHLEYSIQAWSPHLQKDILLLENVQRRFTKIIPGLHHLPYEERLMRLNLTSLETRRIRGDMIEVFKIIKGFEDIKASTFFIFSDGVTRGHPFKIYKQRCRLNIRKYFFSQRVVDIWNSLPARAVLVSTINEFKSQIDKFLRSNVGAYMSQSGSLLRHPPPINC